MARHSAKQNKAATKTKTKTALTPVKKKSKPKSSPGPAVPAPVSVHPTSHEGIEALPRSAKLVELQRQLFVTKTSTASLGKYDTTLKGESERQKGKRRQFEQNEVDATTEKERALAILGSLDNAVKVDKIRQGTDPESGTVNVRKAIRTASRGRGSASLASTSSDRGKSSSRIRGRGASSRGGGSSRGGRGASSGRGGVSRSSNSRGKPRS